MTDVEFTEYDDCGILTHKVWYKGNYIGEVLEDMGRWWYRAPSSMMHWKTTDMDSGAQELIGISGIN